ncbi:MAG: hypothetical protein K6E33_05935 [Lachnospiraceae bacterium]|nr:hypothetical protein [Lachnospiraceae bacterium]
MNAISIIMILVGAVIAILGFVIPDGAGDKAPAPGEEEIKAAVDKEIDNSRIKLDGIADETVTYAMEKAERSMERLTNEKMTALGEYSETILSEIDKNHKEVLFMYDMLQDKHENLKDAVSEASRAQTLAREAAKKAEKAAVSATAVPASALETLQMSKPAMSTIPGNTDRQPAMSTIPGQTDRSPVVIPIPGQTDRSPVMSTIPGQAVRQTGSAYAGEETVSGQTEPAYRKDHSDVNIEQAPVYDEDAGKSSYAEPVFLSGLDALRGIASKNAAASGSSVKQRSEEKTMTNKPVGSASASKSAASAQALNLTGAASAVKPAASAQVAQPVSSTQAVSTQTALSQMAKPATPAASERTVSAQAADRIDGTAASPVVHESNISAMTEPATEKKERVLTGEERIKMSPFSEWVEEMEREKKKKALIAEEPVRQKGSASDKPIKNIVAEEETPVKEALSENTSRRRRKAEPVKEIVDDDIMPVVPEVQDLMLGFDNDEGNRSNNDRILELHRKGKSNTAIARQLGIGVGEVKLVIDLFEAKK